MQNIIMMAPIIHGGLLSFGLYQMRSKSKFVFRCGVAVVIINVIAIPISIINVINAIST